MILDGIREGFSLLVQGDPEVWSAIRVSLMVSTTSTVVSTLLAVPVALSIAHSRVPGRGLVIGILNTLMALPTVLVGLIVYALVSRSGPLGDAGILYTPSAMVVGQVMEDYSAQAMSVVNKRLDVLTTVGTAAPLLGMTGTVTGMIASFAGLAESGSMGGGGGAVAGGIAEALVTTAAGLVIALTAVIPQSAFNRWSDEIELEIEESTADFVEFILTHH